MCRGDEKRPFDKKWLQLFGNVTIFSLSATAVPTRDPILKIEQLYFRLHFSCQLFPCTFRANFSECWRLQLACQRGRVLPHLQLPSQVSEFSLTSKAQAKSEPCNFCA